MNFKFFLLIVFALSAFAAAYSCSAPDIWLTPQNGPPGTIFFTTVDLYGCPIPDYVTMTIGTGTSGQEITLPLKDDGTKGDLTAGDGIYSRAIDSTGAPEGNYFIIYNGKAYDPTPTPPYPSATPIPQPKYFTKLMYVNLRQIVCNTIFNSGDPADKLDIVFVGEQEYIGGYPTFENDLLLSSVFLSKLQPFKSQTQKVNVHYVPTRVTNLRGGTWCGYANCYHEPENYEEILNLANACPNDQIVFLSTKDFRSSASESTTNPGIQFTSAYNYHYSGDEDYLTTIVAHEFGHSFGLLYDEYIEPERGSLALGDGNCRAPFFTGGIYPDWDGLIGQGEGVLKVLSKDEYLKMPSDIQKAVDNRNAFINAHSYDAYDKCVRYGEPQCQNWNEFITTFSSGCSYVYENYRPTLLSIMGGHMWRYWVADAAYEFPVEVIYGPYNVYQISKRLENYK